MQTVEGSRVQDDELLRSLSSELWGRVLLPGDAEYDSERRLWNSMFDKRPSALVQCAGASDVATAVRFARHHDLEFTVRAGGHGASGDCLQDGVLAIDLSPMTGVVVDPATRRVTVLAGTRLGLLDRESQAHGLAVPSGTVPDTGVAGLTLGGGLGWLMRAYGATVDHLRAMEIVTVDGDVRRVTRENEPELFWGMCGGGGNFAITTAFEFEARPLAGPVLFGSITHAANHADAIRHWRDVLTEAPDEVGSTLALKLGPELHAPPGRAGELLVTFHVVYVGDLDEGARALRPLREWGDPLIDTVGPTSYVDLQAYLGLHLPPGARAYEKGGMLDDLSDPLVEALVREAGLAPRAAPRAPDTTGITISALGGAFTANAGVATSMPRAGARWNWLSLSMWMDPDDDDRWIEYPRRLTSLTEPFSSGRVYLNQDSSDRTERVREAFGAETHARLVALKDRWDPTNVLRFNKNIVPSASTGHS